MAEERALSTYQKLMFYAHDGKHGTHVAIRLRLDEEIDFNRMDGALADACKRFPYFQYRLVERDQKLFITENPTVPHLHDDPLDYLINGHENDGFQYRLSACGDWLTMSMFHGLTDGTGLIRFLSVILQLYYGYMGEDITRQDGYDPNASATPEEYADPSLSIPQNIQPSRPTPTDKFYRIPQQAQPKDGLYVYVFSCDRDDMMTFAAENDGSPNAICEILLARAIQSLRNDDLTLPVRISVAINAKKFVGAEASNQCFLQNSEFDFDESRFAMPSELLHTLARGKIIVDCVDDKMLPNLKGSEMLNVLLAMMPSIDAKRIMCRQSTDVARSTASVSYAGQIDLGPARHHISQMFTYGDVCAPLLEINYLNERFFFALSTSFDGRTYAEALIKQAEAIGLRCSELECHRFVEGTGERDGLCIGENEATTQMMNAINALKQHVQGGLS